METRCSKCGHITSSTIESKREVAAKLREVIDGGNWTISNNGNPAGLIALRQFDGDGNLLSYTHHNTVLEAFAAMESEQPTGEGVE